MDEFGAHRPSGVNRLILFLVRMGFGRGKLKRVFSRAWQASSPDMPVDFAYHGLRLRLRPVGNTIESKILFSSRLREAEELAFIRQYLTGGGCFVDIGANVGYYALMAAHAGATQVLAAEPNPDLVDRFAANITLNGHDQQITILPVAIGAADDTARLHLKQGDTGGSSIVRNAAAAGRMRLCHHCRNTWQFGAGVACIVSFSVPRPARWRRPGHWRDIGADRRQDAAMAACDHNIHEIRE